MSKFKNIAVNYTVHMDAKAFAATKEMPLAKLVEVAVQQFIEKKSNTDEHSSKDEHLP